MVTESCEVTESYRNPQPDSRIDEMTTIPALTAIRLAGTTAAMLMPPSLLQLLLSSNRLYGVLGPSGPKEDSVGVGNNNARLWERTPKAETQ